MACGLETALVGVKGQVPCKWGCVGPAKQWEKKQIVNKQQTPYKAGQ